jgi:anthranilate synthase/aminodeoxychorismate synthase-like glutamine amidotransferase
MILLIDNYDSFVYNLARYVRELGAEPSVIRNDALTLDQISALAPSHILISPGPCSPAEAGISTDLITRFGATIPILGVCLGHQCIGAAYGGRIVRAGRPMHGKTSTIRHEGSGVFRGLPSPLTATRYHSLVIAPEPLPEALRATAWSEDGEIMAVEHRTNPVPPRVGADRVRLPDAGQFPDRWPGGAGPRPGRPGHRPTSGATGAAGPGRRTAAGRTGPLSPCGPISGRLLPAAGSKWCRSGRNWRPTSNG